MVMAAQWLKGPGVSASPSGHAKRLAVPITVRGEEGLWSSQAHMCGRYSAGPGLAADDGQRAVLRLSAWRAPAWQKLPLLVCGTLCLPDKDVEGAFEPRPCRGEVPRGDDPRDALGEIIRVSAEQPACRGCRACWLCICICIGWTWKLFIGGTTSLRRKRGVTIGEQSRSSRDKWSIAALEMVDDAGSSSAPAGAAATRDGTWSFCKDRMSRPSAARCTEEAWPRSAS
mmetsp:Transcript_101709/g.311024  ORF Transcript_101709/g.311024 Transcript_101709/m.311024 type:complete len:228 (+) Transcript_101709:131-814(+)